MYRGEVVMCRKWVYALVMKMYVPRYLSVKEMEYCVMLK